MTEHTSTPYQSIDPGSGEVLGSYDTVSDKALEAALAAGHAAFGRWRTETVEHRAALLDRIAREFEQRSEALAALAVREMGKPVGEAREEVEFCVAIFDYYAQHAPLAADQPIEVSEGGVRAVVQKQPIGLLLGVTPWNFPFDQVARSWSEPRTWATLSCQAVRVSPPAAAAIQGAWSRRKGARRRHRKRRCSHVQVEQVIGDRRIRGVLAHWLERGVRLLKIAGSDLKSVRARADGSDPNIGALDTDDVPGAAQRQWKTLTYNTGQAATLQQADDRHGSGLRRASSRS